MPQIITEAIAPKHDRTSLTSADRQIIANVLTWDMQQEVSPEEIETIAISHDIVWIKLTDNRAIPLHIDTFRSIRRQQLDEQAAEEIEYVTELEAKLEKSELAQIEIDAPQPGIYRVWKGIKLIGLVRHKRQCNRWLAEPVGSYNPRPYFTADDAIQGLLLGDNSDCLREIAA